MFLSVDAFRNWKHKQVTLMGMSGVGKTHLSGRLRTYRWFHYSGDYRIGTRYLDEAILDLVKTQAMRLPWLADLLRKDWIYIRNNIHIDDLGPVLGYIGKLGDPGQGGIALKPFQKRQALYHQAEINAMYDVGTFIEKSKTIYGYPHFINDTGGSVCEISDPGVIQHLGQHTLILYIQTQGDEEENKLIHRAKLSPKPLYYRPDFLNEQLAIYLQKNQLNYAAEINPDDFARWIFPRLFRARTPRYEAIANTHGYTVSAQEAAQVRDEKDFFLLLEQAIARR